MRTKMDENRVLGFQELIYHIWDDLGSNGTLTLVWYVLGERENYAVQEFRMSKNSCRFLLGIFGRRLGNFEGIYT